MKKKLILGVTLGGSSRLLDGQAKYFMELGYDVYLISQDHYKEPIFCAKEGIRHLPVDIVADISLFKDLKALAQIIRHFRKIRPDIINVGTPKMGLLGMLAASLLGVKKRIYTCRGLRFETEKGIKRWILMNMERITTHLCHRVIYVSPSLKRAAISYGVGKEDKSVVIGLGSSNGVNVNTFKKDKINPTARESLLREYRLEGKVTIGFVGRVTKQKGCCELVEAFEILYKEYKDIQLVMMGHIKCSPDLERQFRSHPGIIHIPFQDDVPLFMSLFDILVLPSWREGFPNVPIQASAMGIPAVVSDATGCVDVVCDDWNGKIFNKKSVESLTDALRFYLSNPGIRSIHGNNGIKWSENFKSAKVWDGIENVYQSFV